MTLMMHSDLAVWELNMPMTVSVWMSLKQSIGSFRYGVLAVTHWPGSGDVPRGMNRYSSAHSDTWSRSRGLSALKK